MRLPTPLTDRLDEITERDALAKGEFQGDLQMTGRAYLDHDYLAQQTRYRVLVHTLDDPGLMIVAVVGFGCAIISAEEPPHPAYLLGKATDNQATAEFVAWLLNYDGSTSA